MKALKSSASPADVEKAAAAARNAAGQNGNAALAKADKAATEKVRRRAV